MYSLNDSINNTELEPSEFSMGQNYPNPFNEKTVIKYCVAYKTRVKLTIYNEKGKEIEKLVDEEQNPGTYEVEFSTCHSREIGNPEYKICYCRLEAANYKCEKKMELKK